MLPRISGLKVFVFCKRIIVLLNESFAPIGGMEGESYCHLKGRSGPVVASTYNKFTSENRDIIYIIFWLDNCSGQNKNWYLYTTLFNEVISPNSSTKAITLKYFEPGHLFMSADSFHHQVEQRRRQRKTVEDFHYFVKIVDSCGKIHMQHPFDETHLDARRGLI